MRQFGSVYEAAKNATFAKPAIVGKFEMPQGTFFLNDLHATFFDAETDYYNLIIDWGALGASLEGFGEAFAVPQTTVTIANVPEIISNKRFSYFLPRFLNKTFVTLFWLFEDLTTPELYYSATALKGPITEASFNYETATVTITSQAETLMRQDLLRTIDKDTWTDCPEVNHGRAIPILVNQVDRMPAFIYGTDRSKLLICEDTRPAVLNFDFGSRYWQGAEVNETETSLGPTHPIV